MKKIFLILSAIIFCVAQTWSQEADQSKESGKFMLGIRTTMSAFSDDGATGQGIGGQFRLKFGSRVNSDWFADYITTDISGLARRTDYHIGWSVLYYPFNNQIKAGKFTPYVLAGHCFDYTKVQKNSFNSSTSLNEAHRLSSAVQTGLGMHYNLADNFDVSLTTQYMIHLGNDINATVFTDEVTQQQDILIKEGVLGLEGHLLINLSLNVYIADLWNKK